MASTRNDDKTRGLQRKRIKQGCGDNGTPPAAIKLSRLWNDQVNARSLSYDESCCLHLANSIECNDPDFCHGPISLTSFDLTNDFVRIGAPEHWQLVHRPVPVIVVSWAHRRVQIDFPIF